MSPEGAADDSAREIRVEGPGLLVLGGALLVLLGGAFFLGVWVGRGAAPEAAERSPAAPSGTALESPADAAPSPSYFDTAGGAKSAEPEREVRPARGRTEPAPSPAPPATAPASRGPYFVQVFAGRDRAAAETLLQSLTARGYPVRLDSQREGRDALYKVRVGGYPTQDEARTTADRLKNEGETGAWVTLVR